MDLKKLVEKWGEILNEGSSITNPKVLRSTAIMLENEQRYLSEAGHTQATLNRDGGYVSSGDFHKIAIPMVRRTFPELIAHEIVGVQPLTGPVGIAFALRYKAGDACDTYNGTTDVELGHNTIDSTYSGSVVTSAGEKIGSNTGCAVGTGVGLGIGSGQQIKEINMTIEKAQVEAKTRKLRSRWSLEIAQDLKAMHGLDIEEEMFDILSYEITAEIDRELIAAINAVAPVSTWDYNTDADGRWEAERYRNLYNLIIRKANEIAINTRRGSANFAICSPTVCAALEALPAFTICPVNGDVNTAPTGIARIGSLDGRINIYRDTFAVETTGASGTNCSFTLGYKGPSEFDSGVIFLPYVQLLTSKATFEDSFNNSLGLMSRYGVMNHMFGAGNYYSKVNVSSMP